MEEKKTVINNQRTVIKNHGAFGGAYFLGFVGAFVYYIQHAATFSEGLYGFVKALFWPAVLIYHVFAFLHL